MQPMDRQAQVSVSDTVGAHPLQPFAGHSSDPTEFAEYQEEIRRYRQEVEAREEVNTLPTPTHQPNEDVMSIVQAEFDGRVFVPCEEVQLPVGARVQVVIPGPARPPTAEEDRQWQEITGRINSSEPEFPSVEEALRYTRKRP